MDGKMFYNILKILHNYYDKTINFFMYDKND